MSFLRVAFLNVGQGDTTIVYDPDTFEAVIVDCNDYIKVLNFLKANNINRIRALIITHSHLDHYSGVTGLLKNCERQNIQWDSCIFRWDKPFPVEKLGLLRDSDGHSDQNGDRQLQVSAYHQLIAWAIDPINKKKLIPPEKLPKDTKIERSITFCHPEHQDIPELYATGSLNNLSIVIQVKDGVSALLTGDIEPPGWEFLRTNYPSLIKNEVLKFPHHGVWKNSDVGTFLDEVDPKCVVISVGSNNTYNHPSPDILAEIRKRRGTLLLCTQVTKLCINSGMKVQEEIQKLIHDNASFLGVNSQNGSGCPCSGTVVVELGNTLNVIWPNEQFFKMEIIGRFMHSPQCIP